LLNELEKQGPADDLTTPLFTSLQRKNVQ